MKTHRRLRTAALTAVVAAIASSALAASALAVPATFNTSTGQMRWQGSFTITPQTGTAKTCSNVSWQGPAVGTAWRVSDGSWWPSFGMYPAINATCTGNTKLQIVFRYDRTSADYNAGYTLTSQYWTGTALFQSPYGNYLQGPFTFAFNNAVGATPSQVVFNNTMIGSGSPGGQLKLNGTLNVTNGSGGSVTLSH